MRRQWSSTRKAAANMECMVGIPAVVDKEIRGPSSVLMI